MATTPNDDSLSSHRVRSNVWPTPHMHSSAALIAAIDAVFEQPIEDKS